MTKVEKWTCWTTNFIMGQLKSHPAELLPSLSFSGQIFNTREEITYKWRRMCLFLYYNGCTHTQPSSRSHRGRRVINSGLYVNRPQTRLRHEQVMKFTPHGPSRSCRCRKWLKFVLKCLKLNRLRGTKIQIKRGRNCHWKSKRQQTLAVYDTNWCLFFFLMPSRTLAASCITMRQAVPLPSNIPGKQLSGLAHPSYRTLTTSVHVAGPYVRYGRPTMQVRPED